MKYKLYSSCLLVNGANRSIIMDLNYNRYHCIPLALSDILSTNLIDFDLLIDSCENTDEKNILAEYLNFLLSNDFVFQIDENEENNFIPMPLEFENPFNINDIIIDISNNNVDSVISSINDIKKINIKYFQVRVFDKVDIMKILLIIKEISGSIASSIQLFLPFEISSNINMSDLLLQFPKLVTVFIYNGDSDRVDANGRVIFSTERNLSSLHCGIVSPVYFSVNIPHITESMIKNSCLNKKIAIDINGEIKNCPSLKQSYGNIRDTDISQVISNSNLFDLWSITKDNISVCRDCEFRYICTDCRAYVENPLDKFSKPLKCGYDPYNSVWSEWKKDPFKQKAIEFYGMQQIL